MRFLRFSHWAVKALVIGKLRGIFIAGKRKPMQILICCLMSPKVLLDRNNYKRFSFCPWLWRFPAMFCHAGPSSLPFLAGCFKSKYRRMDCSFNWSYINYGELRCVSVMIALKAMNLKFQLVIPPLVITLKLAICSALVICSVNCDYVECW